MNTLPRADLIAKLRELAALKPGDNPPDWLLPDAWGGAIGTLAGEAAYEIEYLRKTLEAINASR